MSAGDNPYDMDAEEIATTGLPTARPTVSPDCAVAKHRACTGDAWDHDTDQPTDCACECGHGKDRP